jgi:hypothetical protein
MSREEGELHRTDSGTWTRLPGALLYTPVRFTN